MMNEIIATISQPWPWYVAGPMIALVMLSLLLLGNRFGISSNLRTVCSILGAGKSCEYFDFDWKAQKWNLIFALGMILGGAIAAAFLTDGTSVAISDATKIDLIALGVSLPNGSLVPDEIFTWESLLTLRGIIMLVLGGFLVGFGTRYASGCTSGHAISGLSNLQLPSLIAVIGFFAGGLFVTYLILPFLITL
jgi:uncharacterized protein